MILLIWKWKDLICEFNSLFEKKKLFVGKNWGVYYVYYIYW